MRKVSSEGDTFGKESAGNHIILGAVQPGGTGLMGYASLGLSLCGD